MTQDDQHWLDLRELNRVFHEMVETAESVLNQLHTNVREVHQRLQQETTALPEQAAASFRNSVRDLSNAIDAAAVSLKEHNALVQGLTGAVACIIRVDLPQLQGQIKGLREQVAAVAPLLSRIPASGNLGGEPNVAVELEKTRRLLGDVVERLDAATTPHGEHETAPARPQETEAPSVSTAAPLGHEGPQGHSPEEAPKERTGPEPIGRWHRLAYHIPSRYRAIAGLVMGGVAVFVLVLMLRSFYDGETGQRYEGELADAVARYVNRSCPKAGLPLTGFSRRELRDALIKACSREDPFVAYLGDRVGAWPEVARSVAHGKPTPPDHGPPQQNDQGTQFGVADAEGSRPPTVERPGGEPAPGPTPTTEAIAKRCRQIARPTFDVKRGSLVNALIQQCLNEICRNEPKLSVDGVIRKGKLTEDRVHMCDVHPDGKPVLDALQRLLDDNSLFDTGRCAAPVSVRSNSELYHVSPEWLETCRREKPTRPSGDGSR